MLRIHQESSADGYSVIRPEGELDAFTVAAFRRALANMAGSEPLVIDLSGVVFMDTAGLGALVGGIRRTKELGGQVSVACSRPGLTRVLTTTGLDSIVTVVPNLDEAAKIYLGLRGNGPATPETSD